MDVVDLLFDRGFVVGWVGGDVDEVVDVWFDDYGYFGLVDVVYGVFSRSMGVYVCEL